METLDLIKNKTTPFYYTRSVEDLKRQLKTENFANLSGGQFYINGEYLSFWEYFKDSWNHLEPDNFLNPDYGLRERRLSCFHFHPTEDNLERQEIEGYYYQSKSDNQLNGGIKRKFGIVAPDILASNFLQSMIRFFYSTLPLDQALHEKKWIVYFHQFRIIAQEGLCGQPAPEGIHRDGHFYTVQVFINRKNVTGGQSFIHDDDKTLKYTSTFEQPFDGIILNDEAMLHDVSDVHLDVPGKPATRDIFTINFNLLDLPRRTIMS